MPERVAVFIDWQNVYRGALRAFHGQPSKSTDGQVDPLAIAQLLSQRGSEAETRELTEVRVYSGRPQPNQSPRTYEAHMRQCNAWEQAGATVITRPLQYLPGQPPREKGIDVQIAMDIVSGAYEQTYDVGILFSADTDLIPPLQFVTSTKRLVARAEAAAWQHGRHRQRLSLPPPLRLWCHFLKESDYNTVRDLTNYRPRR